MWWDNSRIAVVFDPNANRAQAGEILVGVGNPQADCPGIVLNHKGAPVDCVSISQYVTTADRDLVDRWKAAAPGGMESIRRIVLEDLSLDTCFALLTFGCSVDGTPPERWYTPVFAEYVTACELGAYPDIGPTRNSLAILHSVLAHSYFEPEAMAGGTVEPISPQLFAAGFRACMTFLYQTLQKSLTPVEPVFPQNAPEYLRALGHYDYEYQQYLMVLQHGLTCQLSLPVLGSNRRRTVDALILEEISPTALVKTLARRDAEHSSTGKGFALLAIYRRNQAMTGNDITISVEPEANLRLHDLWSELERLEDERWKDERPRDSPRDLVSYRERDAGGGFVQLNDIINGRRVQRHKMRTNAPNQPWYDDQGRYTLIAAPKAVESEGRLHPGTRLSWRDDILPALWRLYSPIPPDVTLEEPIDIHGKRLRVARWRTNGNLSVVESPSFAAWLAACSGMREIRSPADLPTAASFEVRPVAGGRAVVHRKGVTLFDDWTSETLDAEALRSTIARVASASRRYAAFLSENPLENAMSRLQLTLSKSRFDVEDLRRWKDQIMIDKPAMLAVATHSVGEIETADQVSLRQSLESHWGLSEQRTNVMDLLDRLDAVMRDTLDELKQRRDRLFASTAAGFGAAFLFAKLAEMLKEKFTMNPYEWGLRLSRQLSTVDQLAREARLLETWEWIVFAAMAAGFLLGFTFFWKHGSRLGDSE